jgi:hypothetical protein
MLLPALATPLMKSMEDPVDLRRRHAKLLLDPFGRDILHAQEDNFLLDLAKFVQDVLRNGHGIKDITKQVYALAWIRDSPRLR